MHNEETKHRPSYDCVSFYPMVWSYMIGLLCLINRPGRIEIEEQHVDDEWDEQIKNHEALKVFPLEVNNVDNCFEFEKI